MSETKRIKKEWKNENVFVNAEMGLNIHKRCLYEHFSLLFACPFLSVVATASGFWLNETQSSTIIHRPDYIAEQCPSDPLSHNTTQRYNSPIVLMVGAYGYDQLHSSIQPTSVILSALLYRIWFVAFVSFFLSFFISRRFQLLRGCLDSCLGGCFGEGRKRGRGSCSILPVAIYKLFDFWIFCLFFSLCFVLVEADVHVINHASMWVLLRDFFYLAALLIINNPINWPNLIPKVNGQWILMNCIVMLISYQQNRCLT